ncbi:TagK domain-containing protein [Erwinia sp. CPCC 100877]|nr:TagK domain-containing protein [Erwinia sp. CPCC 100877]
MNIHFDWPASLPTVALERSLTADNAAVFDVCEGAFGAHNGHLGHDAVIFWWHMARPVMLNLCRRYVCRLDDEEIQYGSVKPLRDGSQVQAGNYRMSMALSDGSDIDEQTFYQIIYPNGAWQEANKVPEVEDILPNGGNYINDLRYFNDVILAQNRPDDVLKDLEVEYKRFLIWQEQDGGHYSGITPQTDPMIRIDHRFEQVREQIKEKTLTECIIARDFLMEKVWPELEHGEQATEIFAEEEKTDLLRALSPEHIVAKGKYKVPELVFQDFYKVGLDSHY